MKKLILSFCFIISIFALSSVDGKSQSLDIVNNGNSDMRVTYCSATSVPVTGGGTTSVSNPCPSSPPCSVSFEFGSFGSGCTFTIPLSPCPVAGVPYSYGVSGYATGCAVANIDFSITIDVFGNVVITFTTY